MGKRGPKPKPSKLLEKRGAYKNHPERRRFDLEADPNKPQMPADFTGALTQKWLDVTEKLEKLGILSRTDEDSIETYCRCWVEYLALCKRIKREGYISKTGGNGRPFINPVVNKKNEVLGILQRLWQQFGMTPSARAGLSIEAVNKDSNPFEQLKAIRGEAS